MTVDALRLIRRASGQLGVGQILLGDARLGAGVEARRGRLRGLRVGGADLRGFRRGLRHEVLEAVRDDRVSDGVEGLLGDGVGAVGGDERGLRRRLLGYCYGCHDMVRD